MHIPRKRFGQHFLKDQAIIHQIVAALSPKQEEHLIEIGPGQGAITLPVLKKTHYLEAVELDRSLIPEILARVKSVGELKIYSADALEFDFNEVKKDARPLRIFGNLPYNISTPLLFHLLTFAPIVSDMLFMLQKEVADRLSANAGEEAYGRLSVIVQYHCKVEHLFDVPPDAFYPPPKVQSSIVRIIPYQAIPFPANNYALFTEVVKQAFGQRRKTLRNSLKKLMDEESWAALSFHSDLRPEELSVKEFVAISNVLEKKHDHLRDR